jgi:hypothetical protein
MGKERMIALSSLFRKSEVGMFLRIRGVSAFAGIGVREMMINHGESHIEIGLFHNTEANGFD